MDSIAILSAGAAQGLAGTLAARDGLALAGTFGAVGGILEKFLAGESCELVILTHAQVAQLTARNRVGLGFCSDLGTVRTSVAVRAGDAMPDVATPAALREALRAADAIFFPDPQKATAGIHFAKVIAALGIADEVAARLHPFPNGMGAMRALVGGWRAPHRLHADHRDRGHARRGARGAPSRGSTSSRRSTRRR